MNEFDSELRSTATGLLVHFEFFHLQRRLLFAPPLGAPIREPHLDFGLAQLQLLRQLLPRERVRVVGLLKLFEKKTNLIN
jgi:hypothetical protein